MNQLNSLSSQKSKRPFWLVTLILAFLLLSLMGWLRTEQVILQRRFLATLELYPGPIYIAVSGAIWGIGGLLSSLGLWLRKKWSRTISLMITLLFTAWYWIDEFLFSPLSASRPNLLFRIAVTIISLSYIFIVLFHPHYRRYFRHEQDV